jgi:type I restriction-modification system DNA methylase subunit
LGTFGKIDEEPFDLILTNPPYVTSGSSSIKNAIDSDDALKEYEKNHNGEAYYKANGRGTQSLAIEWIVNNLKQGGEALVVVPDNLLLQKNMLMFLKKNCIIMGIISLPVRTFYATPQKTYILIIHKKLDESEQKSNVFTYLVSEIGETRDSKRFLFEQNDLTEAANLFNLFKTGNILPNSKRCKLVSSENFLAMENWMVDRLWTEEEKRSLGIEEENEVITEDEFWQNMVEIKT